MRISFDLDDTLLVPHTGGRREWFTGGDGCEFRVGAGDLLRAIAAAGHELWVYTSSARDPITVRLRFYLEHRVWLGGVVNFHRHLAQVPEPHRRLEKYPPWFGIQLHVDDSRVVEDDGHRHGFVVVHVAPGDPAWDVVVRTAVLNPG